MKFDITLTIDTDAIVEQAIDLDQNKGITHLSYAEIYDIALDHVAVLTDAKTVATEKLAFVIKEIIRLKTNIKTDRSL